MTDKKIGGKWVIARFQHETNTFSPIPTPLEAFNPFWGPDAYQDQENATDQCQIISVVWYKLS